MAVPFYLPEGGPDSGATTSSSASTSASSSASSSPSASSGSSPSAVGHEVVGAVGGVISLSPLQTPNTTTSATQTPMQSPSMREEEFVMAILGAINRFSGNNSAGTPTVFQYPPPASPSCSLHSPSFTCISVGGNGAPGAAEIFFPRGRSTPRPPCHNGSFGALTDPEPNTSFFRASTSSAASSPSTSSSSSSSSPVTSSAPSAAAACNTTSSSTSAAGTQTAPSQTAQSVPQPMPFAGYYHQATQPPQQHCYHSYMHAQYTPPLTPTPGGFSAFGSSSTPLPQAPPPSAYGHHQTGPFPFGPAATAGGASGCGGGRLHRSHSDGARRSRLTSTGEDEREYHSEHETSWDEFDDRFDNFTAGRERLQEFNGRIPPRKKKKELPKPKPEKKEKHFTWPTVVTVFVFAMGCGFLVAR